MVYINSTSSSTTLLILLLYLCNHILDQKEIHKQEQEIACSSAKQEIQLCDHIFFQEFKLSFMNVAAWFYVKNKGIRNYYVNFSRGQLHNMKSYHVFRFKFFARICVSYVASMMDSLSLYMFCKCANIFSQIKIF